MIIIDINMIVLRIKAHHNLELNKQVSYLLDIKPNNLATCIKRNTIPWVKLVKYANNYNINLNYLIYGVVV